MALSKLSIVIALERGATHVNVVNPLADALERIGSVARSTLEESRPPRADAVIVVDGWGNIPLLSIPEHCQRCFGSQPLLAILFESSHSVSEVLDSGFDHCARWPIPPADIAASVRATLRRMGRYHGAVAIELDPVHLRVRCGQVEATLTKGQFGVLRELLRQPSGWVTSKELLSITSGARSHDTQQIRSHILALRRKLGAEAWRIRWHRSLGYFFDATQSAAVAPNLHQKR
jgi:DNA-binding response OmpR family regulator